MDFDRDEPAHYERAYFERLEAGASPGPTMMSPAEYLEDIKRKCTEAPLTDDDRFVLDMLHREDWLALLGAGTMRIAVS